MVDIHCHILPRMDDGASDMEEALAMARMAAISGVTDLVATPHFPGRRESMALLPKLKERYEALSAAIARQEISLTLHRGAEILCTGETVELAEENLLPTIGDTRYLLTEFYFDESRSVMDAILEGIAAAGYIPVVAHPERYDDIQRDPLFLQRWFHQGYVLQMNKGSILGAFGSRVRHTAEIMMRTGLAHLIASDAHSAERRTPHMGRLMEWMDHYLDPQYARILLEENPHRLIRGDIMRPAD